MSATQWKEQQLWVKLGYGVEKLRKLYQEAQESHLSYDQILDIEMQRLREVRRRVR